MHIFIKLNSQSAVNIQPIDPPPMHHLTARFDPAAQVASKENSAMSQTIICPGRGLFLPMIERRFPYV